MPEPERKDVTIHAPAARAGQSAPQPGTALPDMRGAVIAELGASVVRPEPAVRIAQGGALTDAELVTELSRDIKRLEGEKQTLQYACSTISTATVALALMLIEAGRGLDNQRVLIPHEMIDKATGSRVALDDAENEAIQVTVSTQVDRDFAIGE